MARTVRLTLSAALVCATILAARAPLAIASPPTEVIVCKTRTAVAFALAEAPAGAEGVSYAIAGVLKDEKAVRTPPNMRLDAKTGALTWLPTESQAGTYELTFTINTPPPDAPASVVRRIRVVARDVTTDRGQVGKLLRAWCRAGTAAGNTGDFYDNRDRGHSSLNLKRFGQLDRVEYTEAMKKRRQDWAVQLRFLWPHVTLGNSSTASGNMSRGSNTRQCMLSRRAMQMLYRQYRTSQLYIYPEHRDHDAGHNGLGGYGDLFPANTPYVITSQGSSGSDGPFMEAVAFTLAAFRPDTKKRLIETGLLMPTVQMILRTSCKNVAGAKDYLTGKAHPTVFDRKNLDTLKMVMAAHAIRPESLPPMIQLAVVEEDGARPGLDYFDHGPGPGPGPSEKLFDTPAAISRIWRSTKGIRRMVVSAAASGDANNRPLKYHWAILRGDPRRITIKPLNEAGSVVELLIRYHPRMPIGPGSAMESNRVDIGAFVHNGAHYSAPGFICLYSLDDEARTYDPAGKILEVQYGCGQIAIGRDSSNVRARDPNYDITDWPAMLELAGGDEENLPGTILRKGLTPAARAVVRQAAAELHQALEQEAGPSRAVEEALAARNKARSAAKDATNAARKDADKRLRTARAQLRKAQKNAHKALTSKRPRLRGGQSVKERIESILRQVKDDPTFYVANAAEILAACRDQAARKSLLDARRALVADGILIADKDGAWRLASPTQLTLYQRSRIERFNATILQKVLYPGLLNLRFRRNYVNPLLSASKNWRDVYHYDDAGELIGWTRHGSDGREEFTRDGAVVIKRDKLGRAIEARTVRYVAEYDRKRKTRRLKQLPGETILRYEYDGDTDRVGRSRPAAKPAATSRPSRKR